MVEIDIFLAVHYEVALRNIPLISKLCTKCMWRLGVCAHAVLVQHNVVQGIETVALHLKCLTLADLPS